MLTMWFRQHLTFMESLHQHKAQLESTFRSMLSRYALKNAHAVLQVPNHVQTSAQLVKHHDPKTHLAQTQRAGATNDFSFSSSSPFGFRRAVGSVGAVRRHRRCRLSLTKSTLLRTHSHRDVTRKRSGDGKRLQTCKPPIQDFTPIETLKSIRDGKKNKKNY